MQWRWMFCALWLLQRLCLLTFHTWIHHSQVLRMSPSTKSMDLDTLYHIGIKWCTSQRITLSTLGAWFIWEGHLQEIQTLVQIQHLHPLDRLDKTRWLSFQSNIVACQPSEISHLGWVYPLQENGLGHVSQVQTIGKANVLENFN